MFAQLVAGRRIAYVPLLLLALLFVVSFLLMGCSVVPKAEAADPKASQAATPETPAEEPEDDGVSAFGETVTWDSGVSLSVSAPAPYTPTEYAAGAIEGHQTVVFEFVLTNGSDETYDPMVYGTASSGGVDAPGVFDTSANIGFAPTTAVLVGQTIKWQQAYSVLDPANITMEITAGVLFDDAIFTNTAQ